MDLKELVTMFSSLGGMGILAAVLIWLQIRTQNRNHEMQDKLMSIIESNTVAMTNLKDIIANLKDIIEKCQLIHKN